MASLGQVWQGLSLWQVYDKYSKEKFMTSMARSSVYDKFMTSMARS